MKKRARLSKHNLERGRIKKRRRESKMLLPNSSVFHLFPVFLYHQWLSVCISINHLSIFSDDLKTYFSSVHKPFELLLSIYDLHIFLVQPRALNQETSNLVCPKMNSYFYFKCILFWNLLFVKEVILGTQLKYEDHHSSLFIVSKLSTNH